MSSGGAEGLEPGRRQTRVGELFTSFLEANRKLSRFMEQQLPVSFTRHLHTQYKYEVARTVNSRHCRQVIIDVGGGKECPFLPYLSDKENLIIAVDCAEEQLRRNFEVPHKVLADATAPSLPFADESADLIVSRSVVEHLEDNQTFFNNCARVLRPGGILIHTFPGRFAPFSFTNRLLPNWAARWLLAKFHPAWTDECGFRAFYDRCYYSAICKLLQRNGFENPTFQFRYYQSIYFDFFFPLYLVMLTYDLVMWGLGIRNLACGIMVRAQRSARLQSREQYLPHGSKSNN